MYNDEVKVKVDLTKDDPKHPCQNNSILLLANSSQSTLTKKSTVVKAAANSVVRAWSNLVKFDLPY